MSDRLDDDLLDDLLDEPEGRAHGTFDELEEAEGADDLEEFDELEEGPEHLEEADELESEAEADEFEEAMTDALEAEDDDEFFGGFLRRSGRGELRWVGSNCVQSAFVKLKPQGPRASTFKGHKPRRLGSVGRELGIGNRSRPVVDVGVFAVEFIRHQSRIFASMQLRAAAHARHALLPGKHSKLLAHFPLRSYPARQA